MIKKTPELKKLHNYLMKATDCGFISRQELVSMIPPIFLDIQPDDLVLDMCAAPGSKTSQIVEFLATMGNEKGRLTEGAVLANEVDFQRAYILSHQLKRLNSPNMAVINHAAQFLPTLFSDKIEGPDHRIYFDKLLCDVPCSGDGALRKLPIRWRNWSANDAIHLHKLQVQILARAVKLTKVGGLIVYSTCSLNAIENEAVVADIVSKANNSNEGSLELIDVNDSLEGFKMRPGLNKWKFLLPKRKSGETSDEKEISDVNNGHQTDRGADNLFDSYETYEEFINVYKDHPKLSKSVTKAMFSNDPEALGQRVHLDRTARIMPHDNNSGGFYVALIRKNAHVHLSGEHIEAKPKEENDEEAKVLPKVEQPVDGEYKQATHKLAKEQDLASVRNIDQSIIEILKKDYGLTDNFPFDQLIMASNPSKRIQLISKKLKALIDADEKNAIKYVYLGTSVFVRNKSGEDFWRLSQNGIHLLRPYMTKNIVDISSDFFKYLISIPQSIPFSSFDTRFEKERAELEALENGCFCFCYKGQEEELLSVIKMQHSLVMMVAKEDIAGLRVKYIEEVIG